MSAEPPDTRPPHAAFEGQLQVPLAIFTPRRVDLRMYWIDDGQLGNLEKGANSVSLSLLGLSGGIACSTLTTIGTVDLTDRGVAVFTGIFVASAITSLWLAVQSFLDVRAVRRLTDRIREQHLQ